ncbi:Zinc finger protein Gfi-1b [Nymphon striatum]|nr:Zinc finger protein Gfi-1b [Nymphon striatum]
MNLNFYAIFSTTCASTDSHDSLNFWICNVVKFADMNICRIVELLIVLIIFKLCVAETWSLSIYVEYWSNFSMDNSVTSSNLKDVTEFICLSQDDFEKLQSVGDVIISNRSEIVEVTEPSENQNNIFENCESVETGVTVSNDSCTDGVTCSSICEIVASPSEKEAINMDKVEDENNAAEKSVMIDTSNPIYLSDNSIITVDNKKCVIHYAEDLQKMVAYPIITPAKPRGRPKKSKILNEKKGEDSAENIDGDDQPEGSNDAADNGIYSDPIDSGMIPTLTDDGHFVIRSSRKRKQASTLKEYETGKLKAVDSDVEESDEYEPTGGHNSDDESYSSKKKVKKVSLKNCKDFNDILLNLPFLQQVKKRRGRPKRYGVKQSSGKMFLIRLENGQNLAIKIPECNIPKEMSSEDVANSLAKCLQENPKETLAALNSSIVSLNQVSLACQPIQPAPPKVSEEESFHKIIDSTCFLFILKKKYTSVTCSVSFWYIAMNIGMCGNEDQWKDVIAQLQTSQSDYSNNLPVDFHPNDQVKSIESAEIIKSTSECNSSDHATKETSNSFITESTSSSNYEGDAKENGQNYERITIVNPELSKAIVIPVSRKLLLEGNEIKLAYEEHLLSTHPLDLLSCKACDQFALKQQLLIDHYKEIHPKCLCWICGHMAENSASAKKHMVTNHETQAPSCKICDKTYKNHNILKMHIKLVHYPTPVFYECQICSNKFNRKAHLKRHLRTHDPERSHKCSLCDYRGVEKSDLTKHMLVHDEPKHACNTCGHTFRHPRNLNLHMKRHLRQKDYKCGICSYYGYTFTDIRKHIERRHKENKTILGEECRNSLENVENAVLSRYKGLVIACKCNMCATEKDNPARYLVLKNGVTNDLPTCLNKETNNSILDTNDHIIMASTNSSDSLKSTIITQDEFSEEIPQSYQIVIAADGSVEKVDTINSALGDVAILTCDVTQNIEHTETCGTVLSTEEISSELSDVLVNDQKLKEEITVMTDQGTMLKGIFIVNNDIS